MVFKSNQHFTQKRCFSSRIAFSFPSNLVTSTEKILNGKLRFLHNAIKCRVIELNILIDKI